MVLIKVRSVRAALAGAALAVSACASEPAGLSPEQQAVFDRPVDAELVVVAARNAMRYETVKITAPAGSTVRLVIDNSTTTSPAMVHNVLVVGDTLEATVERVGRAALGVPENVPDDPAVLTATPLAGPGERAAVVFEMPAPGVYTFVCTYPGHYRVMRGRLVSTPPAS